MSRDGEVTINKDFDWQIVWPGNSSKVVLGRPDCGWNGEYCEKGAPERFLPGVH